MTNQERQQRSIFNEMNAKKASLADILKTLMETIPVVDDTFEQDKKNPPVQATVDDMFFGGISDSTPCLTPQRSEASTTVLKVPGVIHTTTRKNNVGSGLNELNARKKANFVAPELSIAKKKVTSEYHITPAEHRPTLSEYMMQKEREAKESNPFKTLMETMPVYYEPVYKNVDDTFEQDKKSPPVQATVDDMFFGGINDSTPCLTPEKSQATTTDELETVKFLKTSSKAERENLGFSPKQQDNQKVEASKKAYIAAKSKFLNDRLQTDSSSNESIDTIGKKFKYEVKLPGVIHTTTRKNNVGSGLNELNVRKKHENSFKMPIKNIEESDSKRIQSHLLSQEDSFPELPACAYKPALLPKPSKEKIKEALDKMRNNRKAHNSASVENGVSSDRFKVRPFLCSDIDGYVAPGKRDHNLKRCRVTHDSSKLEAQMERKHGFQSDPSVKHVKADTVVCSITKGNDKKDIRPDEQEPLSEVSKVNVKELVSRFRG